MEQKEGKPGRCRGSDCIHSVRVILGAKETQWTTIFKRNYQKKIKLKKKEKLPYLDYIKEVERTSN